MNVLQVRKLSFRYRGTESVFEGLDLDLAPGEVIQIVGDNGCGKTTLGKLLTGLLVPQIGEVSIAGRGLFELPVSARPTFAVYMAQVSYLQFFTSSISEEISFARRRNPGTSQQEMDEAYEAFTLPREMDLSPMDLSYPQMWRFQLFLLGVVRQPLFLFIDEIVAPQASAQQDALRWVLSHRKNAGQGTAIAYQRVVPVATEHSVLALEAGRLRHV